MEQVYLSDTELYFTEIKNISGEKLILVDEEVHHISKVMRHVIGDQIYVTAGTGIIFQVIISEIEKKKISCDIKNRIIYHEPYPKTFFCLPLMKSSDRLEFALEKLVELGFTKFIIYSSAKGSSRNFKHDRLEKIAIAAMKQSLRAFVPEINFQDSLSTIFDLEGRKIVFDQNGEVKFSEFVKKGIDEVDRTFLIIGPEAGFSEGEYSLFKEAVKLKLAENRLRTETAAIVAGVFFSKIS